jgi:hypothetical protein
LFRAHQCQKEALVTSMRLASPGEMRPTIFRSD